MGRIRVSLIALAIFAAGLCCPWTGNGAGEVPPCSLSDVVLFGVCSTKDLEQQTHGEGEGACVRQYLAALAPDSPLRTAAVPAGPEDGLGTRKGNLIEQMVTLLGEGVRSEAASFASALPLGVEWEGMSEGPLEEAGFAEGWLERRPATSIAPFLHLFKAHRLRAAGEAARAQGEKDLLPVTAKRYRESLDKARSSANPLIVCIAEDIERRPYVYLQDKSHSSLDDLLGGRKGVPGPPFREAFSGRIRTGEQFRRAFGPRFEFLLEPIPTGWLIMVKESGRNEDLSRLTPPLHSAPNPREIEGWHLSPDPSACLTRAYGAGQGPEHPRRFIFSPEVGGRIDGPHAGRAVTPGDVEEIRRFGRGVLTIEGFSLEPGGHGCPTIGWMTFSVRLEGGY